MAQYELLLPKMGESVAEATVIKWLKNPGDAIALDDTILEIATDKVDSEVPSPVAGKMIKHLFNEDDVAQVGDVIAIIETDAASASAPISDNPVVEEKEENQAVPGVDQLPTKNEKEEVSFTGSDRFYSPLVKSIAAEENLSMAELEQIKGTGAEGRLTKDDLLQYIDSKSTSNATQESSKTPGIQKPILEKAIDKPQATAAVGANSNDEIIEMDRMRKLIADHMISSVATSAHVTSFVEADVTNLVLWRNKVKAGFEKREGEKITFTPLFAEAVAKAIKDFPMVNVSVVGTQIIKKRDINIGMAAALPNGNLIVPVIKNADQLNLVGLAKAVNDLAVRAREGKLKPDETQGGTFTLTNVGTFGNIMGTPIINQPQVAILAVGAIKKKPAVLETEFGDVIAIRHMMFLSLSYDHRVVDGSLGGMFVRRVADYLENWDIDREI
ncbi:2-oxoglutarate dehydrogenase E2 component (dihydrolipoamide succinyltransferase) [Pedobacter sp. UYP30]|uniref:dihydrolipoamide acetyltransferase family protein n=1 Tax=Pedobacter sp. UYP30 TaxID=1756400 RepID=UPI00339B3BE9